MDPTSVRLTVQTSDEDWFDAAFVDNWLQRQGQRQPERLRQYAMLRSLFPRKPTDEFRYIDIACGDGALDEMLLTRFSNAQATLLDGSPAMVERAQERMQRFGDRVRVVQGDLATSGWLDAVTAPFDVAVSSIAIHNLEDPRLVRDLYRDIYGVMAEGGVFMNLEYVRSPSHGLWPYYTNSSSDPEAAWVMPIRSIRDYAGTVEEQLNWLREAGFNPVDCFWKEFRLAIFGGFKGQVRIADTR